MSRRHYSPQAWAIELPADSIDTVYRQTERPAVNTDHMLSSHEQPRLQVPVFPAANAENRPVSAPASETPRWKFTLSPATQSRLMAAAMETPQNVPGASGFGQNLVR